MLTRLHDDMKRFLFLFIRTYIEVLNHINTIKSYFYYLCLCILS